MTTTDTSPGPEAAARLDALRAALDAARPPAPDSPPAPAPAPTPAPTPGPGADEQEAELVERLRSRRSAGHVAAAYSAAHGHPLGADEQATRSRWALSGPAAVGACAVLLLIAVAVLALTSWSTGGGEELGVAVDAVPAAQVDMEPEGDVGLPAHEGASVAPGPEPATDGPAVVVHVVGQVADPGLVDLPGGSRVADALEAAGGATDDADLAALNLARAVVDGEQVYVPAPGEEPPVPPSASSASSAPSGEVGHGGLVPLNTAGTEELMSLPGVGPVTAERIVAWREENGPFTAVEELTEISGVGPALLADVRDLVTW